MKENEISKKMTMKISGNERKKKERNESGEK